MSITLTAEAVGRSATPLMKLCEVVFDFYSAKKRTDVVWMKCLKEHGKRTVVVWIKLHGGRQTSVYSSGFD